MEEGRSCGSARKRSDAFQGALACRGIVQIAIDETVHANDPAGAADGDELDITGVAGLEANGRARSDVETHAIGRGTIEQKRAVHFEEVAVGADLHRPIAAIGDGQANGRSSLVDLDVTIRQEILARDHTTILYRIG
jgi:hypothetical protein